MDNTTDKSALVSQTGSRSSRNYSLRTLLIVVAGIAVILGYWMSLRRILPQWDLLLDQISIAQKDVQDVWWWVQKENAFADRLQITTSDAVLGIVLLVLFYGAKLGISRTSQPWAIKIIAYVMLLSLILPYIYIRWVDWGYPFIFFIGNWLGEPVALLFVPSLTFLFDLETHKDHSLRWLIGRSAIEIIILIPLWSIFWAIFSFWILEFGWI